MLECIPKNDFWGARNASPAVFQLYSQAEVKWPSNFCEFKLYMDVMSQQLNRFFLAVNIRLVHVRVTVFPAAENSTFLVMEVSLCCRFYNKSQTEVVSNKAIMQNIYSSATDRGVVAL